jgi:hypothetical protein
MFGYMDEVRVLNRALTPAQVLNNWLGITNQQDASLKGGGSPARGAPRGVAMAPPAGATPAAATAEEVARGRLPKRLPSRPEPPQRDPEPFAEPPSVNAAEHSRGGGQRR